MTHLYGAVEKAIILSWSIKQALCASKSHRVTRGRRYRYRKRQRGMRQVLGNGRRRHFRLANLLHLWRLHFELKIKNKY